MSEAGARDLLFFANCLITRIGKNTKQRMVPEYFCIIHFECTLSIFSTRSVKIIANSM